jgi:hypothetical protein
MEQQAIDLLESGEGVARVCSDLVRSLGFGTLANTIDSKALFSPGPGVGLGLGKERVEGDRTNEYLPESPAN